MELKQALQVLAVLKAAYPQHYRGLSDGDIRAMATLWASMFEEPFADVMQAVKAHIVTDARGFCPTIGAVKEQLARMRESRRGGALTEHEAWELVRQALKNGCYGAQQEFAKLPPVVQKILGGPAQLREWALLPDEQVGTVIASNFMRSYRARAAWESDVEKLPASVRREFLPDVARRLQEGAQEAEQMPAGVPANGIAAGSGESCAF